MTKFAVKTAKPCTTLQRPNDAPFEQRNVTFHPTG